MQHTTDAEFDLCPYFHYIDTWPINPIFILLREMCGGLSHWMCTDVLSHPPSLISSSRQDLFTRTALEQTNLSI